VRESATLCHTYNTDGRLIIKAKAKECTEEGLESDWETLEINIPRGRFSLNIHNLLMLNFLTNLFSKIKNILGGYYQ